MPYSRFGFSIKKEIGGAVVRNRIRRRVREIVRLHREEIGAGWDLVIHPKKVVVRSEFGVVTAEFLRAVKSGMA
jgi:ribonuclease P protein component